MIQQLKKYVAGKLPQIAKWAGVTLLPKPNEGILLEAKRLCNVAEAIHTDQSGEYKRHQVFSRLIKAFPAAKKRELGLAIEVAVGNQ